MPEPPSARRAIGHLLVYRCRGRPDGVEMLGEATEHPARREAAQVQQRRGRARGWRTGAASRTSRRRSGIPGGLDAYDQSQRQVLLGVAVRDVPGLWVSDDRTHFASVVA